MRRIQNVIVTILGFAIALTAAASASAQADGGQRRGAGFMGRDSLLGLLRIEEVRKDLNLTDDVAAKVTELTEKLSTEMREQTASLRDLQDREERRTKMAEVRDEYDTKTREQLREVLSREQMMRLFQIRMQNRAAIDSLTNQWIAGRLELTDEQKQKLADISKEADTKQSELRASMRDAGNDQRSEINQKLRDLRTETDSQATGVLTSEQKESFESMKGEKLELPRRGGQRQAT